jgi:hypothetical protein
MLTPMSVFCWSSSGASLVTVTVSARVPGETVKSSVVVFPTSSSTLLAVTS